MEEGWTICPLPLVRRHDLYHQHFTLMKREVLYFGNAVKKRAFLCKQFVVLLYLYRRHFNRTLVL